MSSNYRIKATINKNFKPIAFKVKGKPHYQIFLEVEPNNGIDMSDVSRVEYTLHPSFKDRIRMSNDVSNNFQIEIKAWGSFVVKAKLFKNDGTTNEISGDMKSNWHEGYY